jgi:hypothetical protein
MDADVVDLSLLTPTEAVGRVSGTVDFAELPRIGELVSLARCGTPTRWLLGAACGHTRRSFPVRERTLSLADIVVWPLQAIVGLCPPAASRQLAPWAAQIKR